MSIDNNLKLKEQLNYISANIFHSYMSFELFIYPIKNNSILNVAYEYSFHQQIFLESFYIHIRKLTEPKQKNRWSLDTLCNSLIKYNTGKIDNISSIINQLVKILQNIREKEEVREIQKIRDYFAHSIPKSLSELQISHKHILEIRKSLDSITNIIEYIYNIVLEGKTQFNQYQQFSQDYAKRFWDTLTIGTATLNPNFKEYQKKVNNIIDTVKTLKKTNID